MQYVNVESWTKGSYLEHVIWSGLYIWIVFLYIQVLPVVQYKCASVTLVEWNSKWSL